jgi:hypothetical protein
METVALATLCIGSALGLRFRVFVLLPAIFVGVTVITTWALAQGATIGSIAVLNVVGATCLQFGYLGGAVLGSLISSGRFGGSKNSQPARPFAP